MSVSWLLLAVAGTLLIHVKRLEKYLGRLYRKKPAERIYRCSNCGCTYETKNTTCRECWNERLVRIE
ncbi:hypothetical protein [Natrinema caseinilyticum]|uniref:hypothetical protein n=1 Tax=Natrinema caseinilyticum TaxID=2961570 RepID=UPI0020C4FC81|nr:hypothetical protein [Natrinema caseinilyticum]